MPERLYTPEQLMVRDTRTLNRIFMFAGMDATLGDTRYGPRTRAETIAMAEQTQTDVLDVLHRRALAESPVTVEQQIGETRAQAEIAAHTYECARPVYKDFRSGMESWSWFEGDRFVHVIRRNDRWFLRNELRG